MKHVKLAFEKLTSLLKFPTGGGCMVGAIKGSTNKEPVVVGKPSAFLMDYVTHKYMIYSYELVLIMSARACM